MKPSMTHTHRMQGLSLVELMVALALGLVLMTGAISLFIGTRQSQKSLEMLGDVQESGRIAANIMDYAIRMAGGLGLTYSLSPVRVTSVGTLQPNISNNCFSTASQAFDWATALAIPPSGEKTPAVFGENNVGNGGPNVFSGCGLSDVQPGTDILSVTYADPTPVAASNLQAKGLYIHSGVGGGVIFQCPNGTSGTSCASLLTDKRADASGTAYFPIESQIFYVRSWSATQGDNIPTLMRARISGGSVIAEPLVEGVASLQVTYGIDNNDDNYPDQYKSAAQMPALSSAAGLATDWSKIKAVKLEILTQSITTDPRRGSGNTTYTPGDASISIPTRNLARVFSTTVTTRNARAYGG